MTAIFSPCRTWRYVLERDAGELLGSPSTVAFIGLNPSTADEHTDDPTIRRCVDFARRWGHTRLVMLNLYALRATDPRELSVAAHIGDPVGPENDEYIRRHAAEADLVVCAWGSHPGIADRASDVIQILADVGADLYCLAVNQDGGPKHPLYVPASVVPIPYA